MHDYRTLSQIFYHRYAIIVNKYTDDPPNVYDINVHTNPKHEEPDHVLRYTIKIESMVSISYLILFFSGYLSDIFINQSPNFKNLNNAIAYFMNNRKGVHINKIEQFPLDAFKRARLYTCRLKAVTSSGSDADIESSVDETYAQNKTERYHLSAEESKLKP